MWGNSWNNHDSLAMMLNQIHGFPYRPLVPSPPLFWQCYFSKVHVLPRCETHILTLNDGFSFTRLIQFPDLMSATHAQSESQSGRSSASSCIFNGHSVVCSLSSPCELFPCCHVLNASTTVPNAIVTIQCICCEALSQLESIKSFFITGSGQIDWKQQLWHSSSELFFFCLIF